MVPTVLECQCDCEIWTECTKERAVAGGSETACVRVGARPSAWKVKGGGGEFRGGGEERIAKV